MNYANTVFVGECLREDILTVKSSDMKCKVDDNNSSRVYDLIDRARVMQSASDERKARLDDYFIGDVVPPHYSYTDHDILHEIKSAEFLKWWAPVLRVHDELNTDIGRQSVRQYMKLLSAEEKAFTQLVSVKRSGVEQHVVDEAAAELALKVSQRGGFVRTTVRGRHRLTERELIDNITLEEGWKAYKKVGAEPKWQIPAVGQPFVLTHEDSRQSFETNCDVYFNHLSSLMGGQTGGTHLWNAYNEWIRYSLVIVREVIPNYRMPNI